MIHLNDKQNQRKHRKMARRLDRGTIAGSTKNSGQPSTSKLHAGCRWAKNNGKAMRETLA